MTRKHVYNGAMQCCLLAVYTLAATAPQRLCAADPADWAPQQTVFFVGTDDFKQFHSQLEKTSAYRLMTHEQGKQMAEVLMKGVQDALTNYAKKLGLDSAEQLKVLPQGPAALMIGVEPPADETSQPQPHMGLVADFGDNQEKVVKLLNKITATTVERGGKKEVEEFRGVTITTIHPVEPAKDEDAEEPPPNFGAGPMGMGDPQQMIVDMIRDLPLPEHVSYATTGKMTVFGSDPKVVQKVLVRVQGDKSKVLSKNEDYLALKRHCAPVGQLQGFVNIPRMLEMAGTQDPSAKGHMQAAGLDALRALVLSVSLVPRPETDIEVRAFLPVRGEKRGIVKMLTANMSNKPLTPESAYPEGTAMCGWMNFRFETLLDEIYEIRKRVDPQGAEMAKANMKIPTPDGDIVDMEQVFKNFSMPLQGYMSMVPPYERENISFLVSVNHRSREVLGNLFKLIGAYFQKREMLGQSIYDFAMMPVGVSVTLTDSSFAIGNTPGVEQVVRAGGKVSGTNLKNDPQFQATVRYAPKQAWGVIYQDQMKTFDVMMALHRKAKESGQEAAAPAFGFDVTDMMLGQFKESPMLKADNPEVFREFMSSSVIAVTDTGKGIQVYLNATRPVKK